MADEMEFDPKSKRVRLKNTTDETFASVLTSETASSEVKHTIADAMVYSNRQRERRKNLVTMAIIAFGSATTFKLISDGRFSNIVKNIPKRLLGK